MQDKRGISRSIPGQQPLPSSLCVLCVFAWKIASNCSAGAGGRSSSHNSQLDFFQGKTAGYNARGFEKGIGGTGILGVDFYAVVLVSGGKRQYAGYLCGGVVGYAGYFYPGVRPFYRNQV